MNNGYRWTGVIGCLLTLIACTGLPEGVQPVSGFDKDRYPRNLA